MRISRLFLVGMTAGLLILNQAVFADDAPAQLEVEYRPNVEYGTGGKHKLRLHLALPKGGGAKRPVLIFIHGGGWTGGSRDDLSNQIQFAAKQGYVAVSVGYRFAPENPFPAQVEDVKCSVRWLRAHADELQLDGNKLGAIGFSAGAHLAMLLGVMDKADGLEGSGGWADQSSKVQAVVGYFGPTNLQADLPPLSRGIVKHFIGFDQAEKPELYKQASPITYVNKGDAPMLLYQGTEDVLVPYDQAWFMAQALTKAKVPGRVELLLGVNHGWDGTEMTRTERESLDFFAKWLKP
ncbi:MAG: alpha/beta hydrolase [Planctomycetota bacterium]